MNPTWFRYDSRRPRIVNDRSVVRNVHGRRSLRCLILVSHSPPKKYQKIATKKKKGNVEQCSSVATTPFLSKDQTKPKTDVDVVSVLCTL